MAFTGDPTSLARNNIYPGIMNLYTDPVKCYSLSGGHEFSAVNDFCQSNYLFIEKKNSTVTNNENKAFAFCTGLMLGNCSLMTSTVICCGPEMTT